MGEPTLDALERIDQVGARWVELQFLDLAGIHRRIVLSRRLIDESVFEEGIGKLDGSSARGFVEIFESDLRLRPVPETFSVIPWREGVVGFLCTIHNPDGSRFQKDPRLAAERAVEAARGDGFETLMSFEPEFFVFDKLEVRVGSYESLVRVSSRELGASFPKKGSYFLANPTDAVYEYGLELARTLEGGFGVPLEGFHHEVAAGGQIEVNFPAADAATAADRLVAVKYAAREVAARMGLQAVFLPKIIPDDNGSGLHTHVSLWRGGENAFYDPSDDYAELSQTARYFIGGLLEHGRALSAIVSPTVNSYRRLVPDYEAPVYLVWSKSNRSAAVRVPFYKRGDARGRRIEYRPPDPSANPYLAAAAIIAAGLDGIRRKIDPGDPVDENVYRMTPEKRRALGIRELPRSLDEALDELESDSGWLRRVMPGEMLEAYIDLKRWEARRLAAYPSAAEVALYLPY